MSDLKGNLVTFFFLLQVGMSACGNVAFVGYADGAIHSFAMQSGRHLKAYTGAERHTAAVQSIATDSINAQFLSSSFDATVKLWSFQECSVIHTFSFKYPVSQVQPQMKQGQWDNLHCFLFSCSNFLSLKSTV